MAVIGFDSLGWVPVSWVIDLDPIVVELILTQSWWVVLVMGARRRGRIRRGVGLGLGRRKCCVGFGVSGDCGVALMSRGWTSCLGSNFGPSLG